MAVDVGTAQGKLKLDGSQFVQTVKEAYSELDKLNKLVENTQNSLNSLSGSAIDSSVVSPRQVIDTSIIGSLGNTDEALTKTTSNVGTLEKALRQGLSGALSGVGTLAKTTFQAFAKYTQEVAQFAKQSLQVGLQFDATMSQVGAITGAAGDELNELRLKAIQMGADTKFSASEAGQAMVYMGMAGWDTQQVLDGLSGVMSLAASSGEDLATTSDIVTDALTAFKLGAEDASKFANVLAATATSSNTNVSLMGETFKYVASMAGTMNYSIEDTAIAIGLMANNGIKGSQAGTALRNVITNLAKPTKDVSKVMDLLGISLSDEEGRTYSLMEMMEQLRDKFREITPYTQEQAYAESARVDALYESGEISKETWEQMQAKIELYTGSLETVQAKIASMISGKYGLSGLLAIVNSSEKDFNALTDAVYSSSEGMGAAAKMEETMMDNLQGATTRFKSTMETFRIAVSDVFKDPSKDIVNFGQQAIASMTKGIQSEGIPGLIQSIGSIIPQAVSLIIQYIPQILPSLIKGFWALVDGLIDSLPEALPIIVDGAIELFLGLTTGLSEAIKRISEMLPGIIQDICQSLLNHVDDILDAGFELFVSLSEGVIRAIPEILKTILKLVRKIISYFGEHANEFIQTGIDLILELIQGLTDPEVIKELIGCIGDIIAAIISAFTQVNWLEVADKIFSGLGSGLLNIFEGALGAIDDMLGTNFAGWAKAVGEFFGDLRRKSFEFGEAMAQSIHKEEIELNELAGQYGTNYGEMLLAVNAMVRQGISEADALRAAYEEFFKSSEAQYVFRERFATALKGSEVYGGIFSGMSNQQVVDFLSQLSSQSGNVYNFYTNEPLDEKKIIDELKTLDEKLIH